MKYKYTKELLEEAAKESSSVTGVMRYLGVTIAGGNHSHISRRLKKFEIDTSHFTGRAWNAGKRFPCKKPVEEILVVLPDGSPRPRRKELLRAMLENGIAYTCSNRKCNIPGIWLGENITLDIDHINENWLDNRIENLCFLCPNCHRVKTRRHSSLGRPSGEPTGLGPVVRETSFAGSIPVPSTQCECGNTKLPRSSICIDCELTSRKGRIRPQTEKIVWPDHKELVNMVTMSNYSAVARVLGVSDNAVRKRLTRNSRS